MSTKQKKSMTPASQPSPRPHSPLSPTRHSRLQEKHDLQNLNDRLATYIEKVRFLENENNKLTKEVQCHQETTQREVSQIKSMYDHELGDARRLLDATHTEKSRLEIDIKRFIEEINDLKADLAKKTKDLILAENSARIYETRCNELQLKYNQANADAKKAFGDLKDLEKERDKLKKLLDEQRKQLEEESLARIEVENANQTLKEELSFKNQVHLQEMSETRTRRQIEISEIDGQLAEQYEAKLQQALQDLRDQYEAQMANNRAEIETLYDNKIKSLQTAANRHSAAAANALDEARQVRTRIDTLSSRVTQLENENGALVARSRELEKLLEHERLRHAEELAALEGELSRLREEMTIQLQEYQDLMDIKVSLDLEIAAYRKLLESEEDRLKITPARERDASTSSTRSSSQRYTPSRLGLKRKRTLMEESHDSSLSDYSVSSTSKGDIEMLQVDPDGKFVKLLNKGSQEVSLGGWQLLRKAGTEETKFKFNRTLKIEPKGTVTVWSADLNKDHEPPHNLVMKSQRWVVADNMTTVLVNLDGEEVATSARIKKQASSSHLRHRESSGGFIAGEDLHQHLGDPQGDEKCRLM